MVRERGNTMKTKSFCSVGFLLVLAILAVAALFSTSCQQKEEIKSTRNYLIGVINPNKGTQDINHAFIEGLKEYGFIEGQNTTYIKAESSFDLDAVIHDMVARKVDLIFTVTTPATRKAKEATEGKNIPVVYVMQDPVASGLIKSLAQPNGNLTGVQIRGSVPKALEWMVTISPDIKNLFIPIKYDTKAVDQSLEDLKAAAEPMGIKLTLVEVNDQVELDDALASIQDDADAIFIICSIFIHSNVEKLVQAAIEKKLLIGSGAAQHDRGVTIAYGMIADKAGKQASRLANMILNGKSPGEIPSEIAEFYLGLNLKTAELTGAIMPVDVLQGADFIIR